MMTGVTLPIETLNKDGRPPERRLRNAADARAISTRLIQANRDRSRYSAKLLGLRQGNPPYNQTKLNSQGQSYRANFNCNETKAHQSAAVVPFYDLFSGAKYYAEIRCEYGTPDDQNMCSRIVTEEFDRLLRGYDGFDPNMQQMLNDFVGFGRGHLTWDDPYDFHFKHVPQQRVFVPDGTECWSANLDVLMFRVSQRQHTLWNKIKNRQVAESIGWNCDFTATAIMNAREVRPYSAAYPNDYILLQQKMADRDIAEGTRSATIQLVHLFIREFDGSITHAIIVEDYPLDRVKTEQPAEQFLFYKQGTFENIRQASANFFFETVDGSWNGASGILRDIHAIMEAKNRLWCSTIDNAFLRSGITLSAKSERAKQNMALVQIGSLNVLPPDFDVQNAQLWGDINGQLEVNRALDMMLTSNTGVYRSQMEQPQGNPRTLGEVQMQFANNATLSNSAVNRFYGQLDWFYQEIYRRATLPEKELIGDGPGIKQVRDFQKRCRDRQIPREALTKTKYVRAMRNMGNGSQMMRQQSIQSTAQLVPLMNEKGRSAWLDDAIAISADPSAAERWNPKTPESQLPTDQQAMAMLENAALMQGAPVQWTPTQNNVEHATVHLQAATGSLQSIQQGGDPQQVVRFLEGVGPHIAKHLSELQKDPTRKAVFEQLNGQFKEVAKATDQLTKHLQQQQEEQQRQQQEMAQAHQHAQSIQQGTDPATIVKAAETQKKLELSAAKTAHQLQTKDAAIAHQQQTKDAIAAHNMKMKDIITASDIHRKNIVAVHDAKRKALTSNGSSSK